MTMAIDCASERASERSKHLISATDDVELMNELSF